MRRYSGQRESQKVSVRIWSSAMSVLKSKKAVDETGLVDPRPLSPKKFDRDGFKLAKSFPVLKNSLNKVRIILLNPISQVHTPLHPNFYILILHLLFEIQSRK